jgi:uncharacterized membrane-anchored protein YjiN (DUF445 family)
MAKMILSPPDVQKVLRPPHPVGVSESAQDFQRRGLRCNRLIATALLGAVATLFLSTTLAPQPGFLILLVRATAEAALVGGLADWFAVTALFRRPLGLPIPHTAILPRNKDRIGEGLAAFLERNFLSPNIVRAKLRSIDPVRLIADWLSVPANADAVARRLVRLLPHLIRAIDDRAFRAFVGESLGRQLAQIELAALLGRAITMLTANGFDEILLDRLLDFCRQFLEQREEQLYEAAEAQRRRWWIPKAVNRQIAKAIIGGLKELLSKLREPGTPARRNLLDGIERFAAQLSTSPDYRAHVEEAKLRLLEDAQVKDWLGSVWGDIRPVLLADLASPQSRADRTLGAAILSLGSHLLDDAAMRKRINRTIEAIVLELAPWHAGLAQFIIGVVKQWDVSSFTSRVELVVGRDLQYIRITGTLVGGFVGCLLYLLSAALE